MTSVYVDADACPVKDEVYRVAERHGVAVVVVANSYIRIPRSDLVRLEVVAEGLDKADDWIAEHATPADVVVTADVPLAARCVKAGALVLGPNGRAFSAASIGMDLATRNLMTELRDANPTGRVGGGPKPFSPKDRSAFLQALHDAVLRLKRA
ncbi:YaiI/YqxD family protein [Ferrovibrio terrae]|uniref:YaiI/YqxD family protein n=1 Tax=Ferrovibrio terrae TaxID=2594003 RepID=UPI003137E1C1